MHFKHFFLLENKIEKSFIHMSQNPIEEIRDAKEQNHIKPRGLWAGVGKSWIKWVKSEMPEWIGDYIYTFDIKKIEDYDPDQHYYNNSVIRLAPEMVDLFNYEFSFYNINSGRKYRNTAQGYNNYKKVKQMNNFDSIKVSWEAVSKICGGILFSPYNKYDVDPSILWYSGIDVPSVCIFKKEAITNWKGYSYKTTYRKWIFKKLE